LRVRRATGELDKIFEEITQKAERDKESLQGSDFESPFSEITDDDIDRLFSE